MFYLSLFHHLHSIDHLSQETKDLFDTLRNRVDDN
jgi:hypothetical protein